MTATEPYVHPSVDAAALEAGAPVVPPVASGAAGHLRDVLAGALKKAAKKLPLVTYELRSRPEWQVIYDPNMNADLVKGWGKGVDIAEDGQFEIALRALATQCRGLILNGNVAELDGERITFTSQFLQDELGVVGAVAAVRAFYGDDTAISVHYARLGKASGEGLDPTNGSIDS